MEIVSFYDYARLSGGVCLVGVECACCPLFSLYCGIRYTGSEEFTKINEIILNWCKEHPIKTRQSEFLKMFPNADIYKGAINICPCKIDCDYDCKNKEKYADFDCTGCKKAYWLAEVDE